MNIWMHKCKECGKVIDLEVCPYCRGNKKKRESDGKKRF